MPRTVALAAALVVILLAAVAGWIVAIELTPPAPTPDGSGRPNIVLVLTDDQRWDTLWAMPVVGAEIRSPGVEFTDAFVVNPVCCPSRVSTLTGAYSHTTGVYKNRPPQGGFESFRDDTTIATVLQGAGYRTALIGKYLNGYTGPRDVGYVPPGWSQWAALTSDGGLGEYRLWDLSVDGRLVHETDPAAYLTDSLAERAETFIRGTPADQPLFLYFAPMAPHAPVEPADRHAEAFADLEPWRPPSYDEPDIDDKPVYIRQADRLTPDQQASIDRFRLDQYRTLLSVDEAVGRIVGALEETGRLRDTILAFTSDNGMLWGEHRVRTKYVPYEESIRVPLLIRYDRLIRTPGTRSELALNIDLGPTFAAAAGVDLPGADGTSLLPLLEEPSAEWRSEFLIEHAGTGAPPYCAIRGRRYVYVLYGNGARELYDLEVDPYQLANLASDPDHTDVRTLLDTILSRMCVPRPPGFRTE